MKNIDKLSWKLTRIMPTETRDKMVLGQDIEINIKGSVVQEIVGDNQDNSVNICYVIKPLIVELVPNQSDE